MGACPKWRELAGPSPTRHVLYRCPDGATLAQAVVADFRESLEDVLLRHEAAYIALAGGNTPREAYRLLAQTGRGLPWHRIHVFWTDERGVPATHPRSNYRMVWETLLAHVPIPEENIHRVPTELGPEAAAEAYDQALASLPRPLDWVLLGMGADGHTASLFPHTPVLKERTRRAAAVFPQNTPEWRVTLTYPVLNAAARVRVLVQGERKAEALARALLGPYEPEALPIQGVRPATGLVWFLDEAAAARLDAG